MSQDINHQSKLRAYDLYDSGKIHSLEVGTAKASRSLYIQLTACVAAPHTLPVNYAELQNQRVGCVRYARTRLLD